MNSSAESVSVVLPSYRPGEQVCAAVDSMLAQDYDSFELIVVDDSGEGAVADALERRYGKRDCMRVLRHEQNRGVSTALNSGLREASGSLIAIMHDDDESEPNRLSVQADFLRRHPEIGIVGSYLRIIDERGADGGLLRFPVGQAGVFYEAFFAPPFGHPSVMMRRESLECLVPKGYDASVHATEDYDLWSRLLPGTRGANIPECLVRYRFAMNEFRVERRHKQMAEHTEVMEQYWRAFVPEGTPTRDVLRHTRRVCVGGEDEMPDARFALPIAQACCTALGLTRHQGFSEEEMAEPNKAFRRHIKRVIRSLAHPLRRPLVAGRILSRSWSAYRSPKSAV